MQLRRGEPPGLVVELSDGQRVAIDQLRRISETGASAIQIIGIADSPDALANLQIKLAIGCSHYPKTNGGLPLHKREGFVLYVPADFPFEAPAVFTAHTRFMGFPHVQWGRHLCLYVSPDTQWNPSDGMIGFITQLDEWLRRAARNELDDPQGPLHPPVAYPTSGTSICVDTNTPESEWPWFGGAILERRRPNLLVVKGWSGIPELTDGQMWAPTVLLDFELPFEYPRTVDNLLRHLDVKEMLGTRLLAHAMLASERVPDNEALYIGVGTPSRGPAGNITQRRQHLTFWEVEWRDIKQLRAAAAVCDISRHYEGRETPDELRRLIESVFTDLIRWRQTARVGWCSVIENRPEIVTRRDNGTAMDWFRGKRVALWGCGAIGGAIAEHLARAGVAELVLHDRGLVHPGILVRQNFIKANINDRKTVALQERMMAIAPDIKVTSRNENLIMVLDRDDWDEDVDVVIDATASLHVRTKLEQVLKGRRQKVPIASAMISPDAQLALAVLCPPKYGSGPLDVFRRLGLAAFGRDWLNPWIQGFWANDAGEGLRQPEPGCSDPTFVASHADVAALAAQAINVIADALTKDHRSAIGAFLSRSQGAHEFRRQFAPHIRWLSDGIEFRLAANAWRDMRGWIRTGARQRTIEDETGGLLFGELNEALRIVWISNVSGPPNDSEFSPELFVCGTEGTDDLCKGYVDRTKGNICYIGTWHSHPTTSAVPSSTDYAGIASIFASAPNEGSHQLMLIVGQASTPRPEIGAYVFERQGLVKKRNSVALQCQVRGGRTAAPSVDALGMKLGLALSGGGSRAVAFHLGTLRALEDMQLLDEVEVISGVSGGSVMVGLLGYAQTDFADIDRRTTQFLGRGLVKRALWKLLHPKRLVYMLSNLLAVTLPTMVTELVVLFARWIGRLVPCGYVISRTVQGWRWPLRQRYSRTHVLESAMAEVVGDQLCDTTTRQGKSVVFNACELRTGTAFRMSNERYGSWRFGYAPAGSLRISEAVTASAAYPPILPPFDWKREFEKNGQGAKHRVVVTDGGVFENLGVSVMEPGRDVGTSGISYAPDVIIASDAGFGQMVGDALPMTWWSQMVQVAAAVMRKVEDATKRRLHDHLAAGRISGFVYVGLGQLDERVHPKTGNWVDRRVVINYPTNFNSMSEEDIEMLAGRGEGIARSLVTRYLLSD